MGMYVQNGVKLFILLIFVSFLGSCGPMDTLLPSAGFYKVNAFVNGVPLNESSFAGSRDVIRPFFEESVSEDPDVTALVVFLRNIRGEIVGWRVIYALEQNDESDESEQNEEEPENDDNTETENEDNQNPALTLANFKDGDELIFPVSSLDDNLPLFPIPAGLPMGRYTLVSQVMSGRDVLQRTEKPFFYLGENDFSFNGINVNLPGIADSTQLIPRGTVIMLETVLNFDEDFEPYIVWYSGRRKIHEGKYSEGAGKLFWRAPEETGFFSFRAEVFPIENIQGLTGYQREISLLVSSKPVNIHLISGNIPQLEYWYIFEANLNDSKMDTSPERALRHIGNSPKWGASNGTYGIVTGYDNIVMMPNVEISDNEKEKWQVLFRIRHMNDGGILSVLFGSSQNTSMHLSIENRNLVLSLISPFETVSQIYDLSISSNDADLGQNSGNEIEEIQEANLNQLSAIFMSDVNQRWIGEDSFLTVGIKFSFIQGRLSAQLNIAGNFIEKELDLQPISIKYELEKSFQVFLGCLRENNLSSDNQESFEQGQTRRIRHESVVLWDELALYSKLPVEIIIADLNKRTNEEQGMNMTPGLELEIIIEAANIDFL
jgi:hypothetical protein